MKILIIFIITTVCVPAYACRELRTEIENVTEKLIREYDALEDTIAYRNVTLRIPARARIAASYINQARANDPRCNGVRQRPLKLIRGRFEYINSNQQRCTGTFKTYGKRVRLRRLHCDS